MKAFSLCVFLLLELSLASAGLHARGWQIQAVSKEEARQKTLKNGHGQPSTRAINPGGSKATAEQEWWADYKQYFKKHYASKAAEQAAFKRFKANLEHVAKVNLDSTLTWWASPNGFSDMTEAQISKILMKEEQVTKMMHHFNHTRHHHHPANTTSHHAVNTTSHHAANTTSHKQQRNLLQANYIDWNAAGKVMPTKSQGDCGACWAFAGTTAIESAYLIYTGQTKRDVPYPFLSVNQAMECVNSQNGYYSNGCNGGNSPDEFDYAAKNGIALDNSYSGGYGSCNSASVPYGRSVQLSGGSNMVSPANSENALMQAVAQQPVVAYFAVGQDFMNYAGGVYDASGCASGINHALTLYGYQAGDYWMVVNSWGSDWWGYYGTGKIRMTGDGQGPCMMYTFATYPSLSFSRTLGQ